MTNNLQQDFSMKRNLHKNSNVINFLHAGRIFRRDTGQPAELKCFAQ